MPKLSVLMPAYNAERYLSDAIESVLNQSYHDYEVLIVDDFSADSSVKIIQSYRDPRIRLLCNQSNLGVTKSLIIALNEAKGEYIGRQDADDISLPDRFTLQVKYLEQHPECVAVGSGLIWIDPEGDPIRTEYGKQSHEEIEATFLKGRSGLPHPTAMMRKESVLKVGGYRPEFPCAQDVDLFLRLSEVGKLASIKQPLVKYRDHFDSISSQKQRLQADRARTAVLQAYERRGLTPDRADIRYPSSLTRAQKQRYWSYQARKSGFLKTARKYGWRSLRESPWSLRSWRCLLLTFLTHSEKDGNSTLC